MKHILQSSLWALMLSASLSMQAQRVTVEPPTGENICQFSALDLSKVTYFHYTGSEGTTGARANRSTFGSEILLKDTLYTSGVGVHAPSKAIIHLNGATRFVASLGVDDYAVQKPGHGIVDYVISVYKDKQQRELLRGTITREDAATTKIDLDVAGNDYLVLDLQQGEQNWADQVSWGNAYFQYEGKKPATVLEMYAEESSKVVDLPEVGKDGAEIIPLSTLEIGKATCGWGTIKANRSIDGNPITLRDTVYNSGVGTHATSKIIVKLNGAVTRFVTRVGIDDEVRPFSAPGNNNGVVDYCVSLKGEDGNVVVQSQGSVAGYDPTTPVIDVDCNGWKYLILEAHEGASGDAYDHVDWANAYFEYQEQNSTPPVIVTEEEISTKLACATVTYSQPNVRYMHRLRTLNPESTISVDRLPAGLTWNAKRQLVEGIIPEEGVYTYDVNVTTGGEVDKNVVTLTVSSRLQQPVPFMGWLSWNVVEGDISEHAIQTIADAFVDQGLLDAGYNYLCIDDLWHADQREPATGKPIEDPRKFPNGMKASADYVHSKGLKFGIYSDAGSKTCAGRFGSHGYEETDAKQYAAWDVDLLKYDYCFAPADVQTARDRYKAMGDALKNSGRDILFYMCEWGVREPWKWGAETGATCWRCTYDTRDGWNGVNGGIGILQSIAGMKDIWAYSGPNRYNDADMMCVGIHGTGRSSNDLVSGHPGMTQTEYRTQFALWCMWASPLTLSFDLRKPISADDLSIMTHPELIAINQDRMGQQAELISEKDGLVVLAKDLENGDVAISVTNLNANSRDFTFDFSKISALDVEKEYAVRDVWKKKDLDSAKGSLKVRVGSHQTLVYRLADKSQTGIQTISDQDLKVSVENGQIVVRTGERNVQPKRILVSDTSGRIVAATSSDATSFTFPLVDALDVYIVNVYCGGKVQSVKVIR